MDKSRIAMNDLVLTLSIRWLSAADAFAASCVSHEWQAALSSGRDNGNLWNQVCGNTFPLVTGKVEQDIDFRRLALGLSRGKPPSRAAIPRQTFTPTVRPQDFFAIVDLYRRTSIRTDVGEKKRVILASWVCPVAYPFMKMDKNDSVVVLKGANPHSSTLHASSRVESWQEIVDLNHELSTPLDFAAHDVWGASWSGSPIAGQALGTKVTLFRHDTMQSVCVMDETFHKFSFADEVIQADYGPSVDGLHFSDSEAGRKARCLMQERGYAKLSIAAQCSVSTLLPPPHSEVVAMWLEHARLVKAELRRYAPCQMS